MDRNTPSSPTRKATTNSCVKVRTPRRPATGIVAASIARAVVQQTRTAFLRTLSTKAPAKRPRNNHDACSAAIRAATVKGLAPNVRTAISGKATSVTESARETDAVPPQTSLKFRPSNYPPRGRLP
jgi:hypothetical protein